MSSIRCANWRKARASWRSARPVSIIIDCRAWNWRRSARRRLFAKALQSSTEEEIEADIHDGAYKSKQASLFRAAARSRGRTRAERRHSSTRCLGRHARNHAAVCRQSFAAFSIASAERASRRRKCSRSIISFPLPESSRLRTARACAKSRPKFRFGNLWWKLIAHISRPFRFAENGANRRTRVSSRNQSRMRAVCRSQEIAEATTETAEKFFRFNRWRDRALGISFDCLVWARFCFSLTSCATPPRDTAHRVIISVPEQRMALLEDGKPIATYPVSTSKFGLGDYRGSSGTPLGQTGNREKDRRLARRAALSSRIAGAPVKSFRPMRRGAIRLSRAFSGCAACEPQNATRFRRHIYIHGTPEERNIGNR